MERRVIAVGCRLQWSEQGRHQDGVVKVWSDGIQECHVMEKDIYLAAKQKRDTERKRLQGGVQEMWYTASLGGEVRTFSGSNAVHKSFSTNEYEKHSSMRSTRVS